MKKNKRMVMIVVALLIGTNALTFVATNIFSTILPGGKAIVSKSTYDNLKSFNQLFDIKDLLYSAYDGDIDSELMVEDAIKGMTSSLGDPYTQFFNEDEFKELTESTQGTYAGIGIAIQADDNKNIKIATVFEGTPAEEGGLKAGDIINKINDVKVSGEDLTKATSLMKGEEGKEVTLNITRDSKTVKDIELKTAKIERNTVSQEMLEDNIGYIKISEFDGHTADNFKKAIKEVENKNGEGVIIDLRSNPGGLLTEVLEVCSNFVEKGKLLTYTVDKYDKKVEYEAEGGEIYNGQVVILVDGNTASASEIFTGVLKDYKKAVVVGTTTFGKGIVQTMYKTEGGTGVKITTSKYYTPNGVNIHKKGIEPDIKVEYPEELLKEVYDRSKDPQFNKALDMIKLQLKSEN